MNDVNSPSKLSLNRNALDTKMTMTKTHELDDAKMSLDSPLHSSMMTLPPSSALFKEAVNDQNCHSPTSCIAVQRITRALLYYEDILCVNGSKQSKSQKQMKSRKEWTSFFNDENYKHLLNDYHHILTHHLQQTQITDSNRAFESIHNQIMKYLPSCSATKCAKFRRNRRIRERETLEILNCANDENEYFYVETLDAIHCHFIHSLDIGMRVKESELMSDDEKAERIASGGSSSKGSPSKGSPSKRSKKRKVDDTQYYSDRRQSKLKRLLKRKLMPLKKQYVIKGGENKFFSSMNDETGCYRVSLSRFIIK